MTMRTLRFCSAMLLLALTCFALDSKSGTDQYKIRNHDRPYPLSFNEAYKVIKSQHRFDMHPKKPLAKEDYPHDNDIVPDLQVGCGDGLLVETTTAKPVIPKHKRKSPKSGRRKREINGDRKSRAYFAYSVRTPASFSYTLFQPHIYKLQRPYYIPVFGAEGRLPIYFPPQPLFINPGFPLDNPPFAGEFPNKEYIPPVTPSTTSTVTPSTPVTLGNRFNGPVWDSQPAPTTQKPSTKTSTFPPLVHNPDPNIVQRPTTARTVRTTPATRPTPAATRPTPAATRPPAAVAPSTPSLQKESQQGSDEGERVAQPAPNQCAWAIINCCSAGSKDVSHSCFERLGCPGPFWDRSPCEGDFARVALDYALQYYQTK